MKMSQEHLSELRQSVAPLDTEGVRERYRTGDFPRADKVKDLNVRYRWDLLWAAGLGEWLSQRYAEGLHDTHVDTALRAVVAPL